MESISAKKNKMKKFLQINLYTKFKIMKQKYFIFLIFFDY